MSTADSPALTPILRTAPLRLSVLGSFRLERDGDVVRLPTRKAESLLAYLALHLQPHAREKVAALFWGDSPDELARRSLRTALASLRRELGDDDIIANREVVQFNPSDHVWVDAVEFQGQAAQFLATDSPDATAIDFDLYRGELLADFYDDWILPERERLQALYLDALLRMTQRLREQSEYSRAIEIARKVLAIDPANEQAHQQLMFCFWSLGDRNTALKQFDECKRALHDELGVEPSSDTLALYERIMQASIANPSPAAANTNLPIPLTSFIGRDHEIATVKQVLGATRLLTLTGVGGCGKTRLAIQVAREVVDEFADGAWWVELAAAREDERVLQLVVKALGIIEMGRLSPLDMLLNYLQARRVLLVIDNCEHLVKACATLSETILSRCPHVRILTTSREALSIGGEVGWLVPSLSLPSDNDLSVSARLLQSESVRLFVERATAVRQDFALAPANAQAVANICRRLDGIPLALELAAARIKALTVEQIDARLDDRFGLLTTGSRTALPRQQTLRGTIDWSYELLSSAERALLRRLSVFSGGWTLEAAEAVCAGKEVERVQVLDLLTHLADKSLVIADQGDGEGQEHRGVVMRFHMLETMREYARERLIEAAEFKATSDSHVRFFSQLAQADGMRLRGEGQLIAFRQLETEHANLRVAFDWGLEQDANHVERTLDGLRLATSLWQFWNMRSDYLDGHSWLQEAIERMDALKTTLSANDTETNANIVIELQTLKAIALFGQGILIYFRSSTYEGLELFQQCAALAQEVGDLSTLTYARMWTAYKTWDMSIGNMPAMLGVWNACEAYFRSVGDEWGVAWVMAFKGLGYRIVGEYAKARPCSQMGADIRRKLGDRFGLNISLSQLGLISANQSDYSSAQAFMESCLALGRELGFKWNIVIALPVLGYIAYVQDDLERAAASFKEGLLISSQTGLVIQQAQFLCGLVHVSAGKGNPQRAIRLFSSSRVPTRITSTPVIRDAPDLQTLMDNLRAEIGETAFAAAWAEGQAMTLEQAIEEAMSV